MPEHTLWVKSWILPHISSGRKPLEVRLFSQKTAKIGVGDVIAFNNRVRRRVVEVRKHPNIELLLKAEESSKILPGYNAIQLKTAFWKIWGPISKSNRGILVFELGPT
jgi:ASC-1-like (ASCH) protein